MPKKKTIQKRKPRQPRDKPAYNPLIETNECGSNRIVVAKDTRGKLLIIEEDTSGCHLGTWRVSQAIHLLRLYEEELRSKGHDFGRGKSLDYRVTEIEGDIAKLKETVSKVDETVGEHHVDIMNLEERQPRFVGWKKVHYEN